MNKKFCKAWIISNLYHRGVLTYEQIGGFPKSTLCWNMKELEIMGWVQRIGKDKISKWALCVYPKSVVIVSWRMLSQWQRVKIIVKSAFSC